MEINKIFSFINTRKIAKGIQNNTTHQYRTTQHTNTEQQTTQYRKTPHRNKHMNFRLSVKFTSTVQYNSIKYNTIHYSISVQEYETDWKGVTIRV
jgi:hypothetical protein